MKSMLFAAVAAAVVAAEAAVMPYGTYLVKGTFRGEYNTVLRDFGEAAVRAQRADGTVIAEAVVGDADAEGVKLVALKYDHAEWRREVAAGLETEPERGERCAKCFRYSLARAAAWAAVHGYEAFTTSLTVSPHKSSPRVFAAGRDAAAANPGGPAFEERDFKKKDGFLDSVRLAKAYGLYRQDYCGCRFSRATRRSSRSERSENSSPATPETASIANTRVQPAPASTARPRLHVASDEPT